VARRKRTNTAPVEVLDKEAIDELEDLAEALEDVEEDADDELEDVEEETNVVTPSMLAKDLNISPKVLRAWLRKTFPRPTSKKNTSWTLTEDMVAKATAYFTADDEDDTESDED
jgi:hypothetical protein